MVIQAPWDISSNAANYELAIENCRYNYSNGIQFNSPRQMVNKTRHSHNEVVSEKIIFDEKTQELKRRTPKYVIYCNDEDELPKEGTNFTYEETKRAAAEIGIPLVIISRKKLAMQEEQKIETYLRILEGQKSNEANLTQEELLRKIIIGFENNQIGLRFSKQKDIFFTDEKRTQIFDRIVNAIEKMPDKDKQIECGVYLQTIMQEEENKNYTTSGRFIGRELADDYQKFEELITRITENSNENQEKKNFVLQSISNVRTDEINTVISAVAPAEQTKKDPTKKGDNTIDE